MGAWIKRVEWMNESVNECVSSCKEEQMDLRRFLPHQPLQMLSHW